MAHGSEPALAPEAFAWSELPEPGRIIARGTARQSGPGGGLELAGLIVASIPTGYRFVRLKVRSDTHGAGRTFVQVTAESLEAV